MGKLMRLSSVLFCFWLGVCMVYAENYHGTCLIEGTRGNKGILGKLKLDHEGRIEGWITGLEKEKRLGFHVHETGVIDAVMDGKAAKGHFEGKYSVHGLPNDVPRHAGDMGNIETDQDGKAMVSIDGNLWGLRGNKSIIGNIIMVHEREDDGSQPLGNAGDRIAQGVIGIAKDVGNQALPRDSNFASCYIRDLNPMRQNEIFGKVTFHQKSPDTPTTMTAKMCGVYKSYGLSINEYGDLIGETLVSNVGSAMHDDIKSIHGSSQGIGTYSAAYENIHLHGDTSIIGRSVILYDLDTEKKLAACVVGWADKDETLNDILCTNGGSMNSICVTCVAFMSLLVSFVLL